MIPGLNSQKVHNIILNGEKQIVDAKNKVDQLHENMGHVYAIQQAQQSYAQSLLSRSVVDPAIQANDIVLANPKHQLSGKYHQFGTSIVPHVLRERNLFNLQSASGYLYRTDAGGKIDNHRNGVYEEYLKHESIQVRPFFQKMDETGANECEFEVKAYINLENPIARSYFNSIQIHPHLPGTFVIDKIEVEEEEPDVWTTIAENVGSGPVRLVFDKQYDMRSVSFSIRMTEKVNDGFYFGLRHLYFFDTVYDPESYVVFEVERPNYIRSIGEMVTLNTPFERMNEPVTLQSIGAKLYATMTNGALEHELQPSSGHVENAILRNIKKFYVRIPFDPNIDATKHGLTSVYFHSIQER